jgi:hypothetical protein
MATARAPSHQASGNTTIGPYHSHFVDNFGIKYVGRKHAKHLASILSKHYKCLHDWDGQRYLGMTIDWDYMGRAVHASMLDYVPKALTRFQHTPPRIPQHQLYPHVKQTRAQKPSTQKMSTHPHHWTKRAKNTSKRSLALFSTTHAALTAPCYQH